MKARVPGSNRKVVHLFGTPDGYEVAQDFVSAISACLGVEADPVFLDVTDDDVTCGGCLHAERTER